jgi:putative ABC transport system ATP-binding protein
MTTVLRARDLVLEYRGAGGTFTAVDGVSLDVEEHSYTGIVGPSGSGKSSLLYLLCGLRVPTAGSVWFGGRAYSDRGAAGVASMRRASFGFIFQQHFLVNYLGALENVVVGALHDRHDSRAHATHLLERVGLGDKLKHRPYQLSVGERQRVAIVRAMVSGPAVIFADEPTASLDQRTGHDVISLLGEYRDRGAVLVVTHDVGMTGGFDQVIAMRDGRLEQPGPSAPAGGVSSAPRVRRRAPA